MGWRGVLQLRNFLAYIPDRIERGGRATFCRKDEGVDDQSKTGGAGDLRLSDKCNVVLMVAARAADDFVVLVKSCSALQA
ncbi:hypothetical protein D3C76_1065000 [compost metagenome]